MQKEVSRAVNLVKVWSDNYRSQIHCAIYNLLLFNESETLNIRYVYDEDKNEMKVVRIFINKEDCDKLCIEYYYIEDGKEVTDLITEPITDFPTSTMIEIIYQWDRYLSKAK